MEMFHTLIFTFVQFGWSYFNMLGYFVGWFLNLDQQMGAVTKGCWPLAPSHVKSGVAPGLHLSILSRFMRLYTKALSPKVWGRVLLKETDSICHHSWRMYQNNIYSLFAPFTRFASSIFTKQNPCWRIIFVVHWRSSTHHRTARKQNEI